MIAIIEQAFAETEKTGRCTKCGASKDDDWAACPLDRYCPAPDYHRRHVAAGLPVSYRHRRELRLRDKRPDGFWRFTRVRVRSVADFVKIVEHPRCPETARRIAQGQIDRLVGEARRFERRYGDTRDRN
jgi:hypothetical protein